MSSQFVGVSRTDVNNVKESEPRHCLIYDASAGGNVVFMIEEMSSWLEVQISTKTTSLGKKEIQIDLKS